jgi:hypothetical protein
MSIPTKGETFAKLLEHLRYAQEDAAMLAHLTNEGDKMSQTLAKGWLGVSELLKKVQWQVTKLAKGSWQ